MYMFKYAYIYIYAYIYTGLSLGPVGPLAGPAVTGGPSEVVGLDPDDVACFSFTVPAVSGAGFVSIKDPL
jgi:hypothetical protein